jgi:predicted enzyme related to lactoylglutathione lyase
MAVSNEQQTQGSASGVDATLVDARKSAAFYANVLGWNVHGADTDDPKFSDMTGHLIGRWRTALATAREPGLLPYIYVADIRAAVERATAHGGAEVKAIYPEGNLWVATVRDPAGNVIGLWQQAAP